MIFYRSPCNLYARFENTVLKSFGHTNQELCVFHSTPSLSRCTSNLRRKLGTSIYISSRLIFLPRQVLAPEPNCNIELFITLSFSGLASIQRSGRNTSTSKPKTSGRRCTTHALQPTIVLPGINEPRMCMPWEGTTRSGSGLEEGAYETIRAPQHLGMVASAPQATRRCD